MLEAKQRQLPAAELYSLFLFFPYCLTGQVRPETICRLLPEQFLHPFDDRRRLDHDLFDEGVHFLSAAWVYL